jgi:hypothetical protein
MAAGPDEEHPVGYIDHVEVYPETMKPDVPAGPTD